MHTSPITQRRTVAAVQNDTDRRASHHQQEEQFATLLAQPPTKSVAPPDTLHNSNAEKDASQRATPAGAPGSAQILPMMFGNPRIHFRQLRWRLTNGPLAGMTIRASSDEGGIHILISTQDLPQLQRAFASPQQLAECLSRQYKRTVILEVTDADPPTE